MAMNRWGNVNSPMPAGPIQGGGMPMGQVQPSQPGQAGPMSFEQFQRQGSGAPMTQGLGQVAAQGGDPVAQREANIKRMAKMAVEHASSDPNSMVCPTCGGSGIKQGKNGNNGR